MEIEQLLEQYFEGLTTSEDEAKLRRFFTTAIVPEYLMIYKPLFKYFDEEIKQTEALRSNRSKTLILWLTGVAACAAILTGIFFFTPSSPRCPQTGNYVMIDGQCFTDVATIRSATLKSLQEVVKDGEFLPDNSSMNALDMVENQLKGFDFLLDE